MWDSDFWWHIASGKNIFETLSIPDKDPFNVYEGKGIRNDTVLKAEWLGQIILFLFFKNFGLDGVILLKAAILTICLLIVYLRSRFLGAHTTYTILTMFFVGMTALNFTGERPQLLSFLYASTMFLLLDKYNGTGRNMWLFLLLAVIMFWSNSHGAVALGSSLLVLYTVCYAVESKFNEKSYFNKTFLLFIGVSILCTMITPGGINKYLYVVQLQGSELQKRTSEYMSPFVVWKHTGNALLYYWFLLFMALLSLYELFKYRELNKFVTVFTLAVISLTAYRYVPFFIFLSGPYIALGLSRLKPNVKLPMTIINIAVVLISIFVLTVGLYNKKAFQSGVIEKRFPEDAVRFIKQKGIKGKIFNTMDWGGYLIWHLYPDSQIFIDGRLLDLNKLHKYTHILWTTSLGLDFFEQEEFDLVLIPHRNRFTGETYTLIWYLLTNHQWHVLYSDKQGYLFGRQTE
ncbi:MAG: hypothetical protein AB1638_01680 [Nitrospirota bacterium]